MGFGIRPCSAGGDGRTTESGDSNPVQRSREELLLRCLKADPHNAVPDTNGKNLSSLFKPCNMIFASLMTGRPMGMRGKACCRKNWKQNADVQPIRKHLLLLLFHPEELEASNKALEHQHRGRGQSQRRSPG